MSLLRIVSSYFLTIFLLAVCAEARAASPESEAKAASPVDKDECEELQKKADNDTLTPAEAKIWLYCGPISDAPLFGVPPGGLNAYQPPHDFLQHPSGMFPVDEWNS